jgi:hypothetical protein
MSKYSKIKLIGHKDNKDIYLSPGDLIVIQEKMDGSNFRFAFNDGAVTFGSREQVLTEEAQKENYWVQAVTHITDKVNDELIDKYDGYAFYGECLRPKRKILYDQDRIPPFLGFDVMRDGEYLYWRDTKTIFEELGLGFVPVIGQFSAEAVRELNEERIKELIPKSAYRDGPAEGVVFKNAKRGIYAKFVFEPEVQKTPRKDRPKDPDLAIAEEFVHKYATSVRIQKKIISLLEEGHELDMPLMKYLPMRVLDDIVEEEAEEIMTNFPSFDVRKVKGILSKVCVRELKDVIMKDEAEWLSIKGALANE